MSYIRKKVLTGLLAAAVLFLFPFSAQAAGSAGKKTASLNTPDRKTIRVGLPDTDTASASARENRIVSFTKDYMQAVAEYAGWDIVFVPAPWSDCLSMMESGDLDILGDVSKTAERAEIFNYSAESMGTEMCYLFGRADTDMKYEDTDSFNNRTVGYEAGSTVMDSFREYGMEKGFKVREKPYESGARMFEALDAGEVDMVVQTNFYDPPAGHVVLAKCCPSPVYIVTNIHNTSLQMELDEAMGRLFSYNPGFNAEIFDYHLGNAAAKSIGYTEQELNYLATSPTVDVFYETSWEPFEFAEGDRAEGITPDIIRAVGNDTGITFRFVLDSSTQAIYDHMDSTPRDTVMAVSYDYSWANQHDLLVTQPYVGGAVMRVMKTGSGVSKTVATVKGGYLEEQVKTVYPYLKIVGYDTFTECMKAVAEGNADCTFLNYYQASYYRSESSYESFSYLPDGNIVQKISLGVTRESNPALFGVLSKSLQRLSSSTVQGILNENSTKTEPLSLTVLMRRYPVQMAVLLGSLGILIGLLIILLLSANTRKRQNMLLRASQEEAETANRAKTDFLSRMSHDIRTPLNGIIGMTYIAGKQNNPEQTKDCLSKIEISSKFLLGLVNDILDMSKAESGKTELHPEPYRSETFLDYLNSVIMPLCKEKNIRFMVDAEPVKDFLPLIDPLRINQVFFNLLSNAVKFTPEGGKVTFRLRECLTEDKKISLEAEVSDNGIGMSGEFQKILFEPFTQENRNDGSDTRGTGLGLSIVKRLLDLMGCTITVKSKMGEGTTFRISGKFDCVPACSLTAGKTSVPDKNDERILEGKHVLLCEDHPLNMEIAKALLEEKKMVVSTAEDGRQGVERFEDSGRGFYDVILMDIRMPVMDGYQAVKAIRALDRLDAKMVPIIAMTADAFEDDVKKCLDAGMNGHIAKPIDPENLIKTISSALNHAGGK
jgi:signal transduction histidine kinase/CheY-like chemotaxis protein